MKDLAICALLTAVAFLVVYNFGGYSDAQIAQAEYCDMVALWNKTGGDLGWPDFHGTADRACQ